MVLAILALSVAGAAGATGPRLRPNEVDLKVVGESILSTQDHRLDLFVFGPLFEKGAVAYGEPSHTMLFLFLTRELADSPAGEELREEAGKKNAYVRIGRAYGAEKFEVPFPENRGRKDERIAVWAIRDAGDFLVADVRVTLGRFHFTTTWNEWLAQATHCCVCNTSPCAETSNAEFTCCWCPETSTAAGHVECPDARPRP